MAYAKGRWERIERVAERRPWLRYVAVQDARTRPEHMAWHGTVLPVDHPFWRSHYPPNGWRCRCTVEQLSDHDLELDGFTPSDGPPPGSERTRRWTNKRTGKTVQVPVGIDPGFGHNVGRIDLGRKAADLLIAKIDDAGPALARAAIGSPWRTQLFRRFLRTAAPGRDLGDWPVAMVPAAVQSAIRARSHTVRLSAKTARKQADRHPDLAPADYALVQRILDDGELFRDRNGVIGFLEMDGRLWRAVIRTFDDGTETYIATFHKARPNDLRAARRRLKRIDREENEAGAGRATTPALARRHESSVKCFRRRTQPARIRPRPQDPERLLAVWS